MHTCIVFDYTVSLLTQRQHLYTHWCFCNQTVICYRLFCVHNCENQVPKLKTTTSSSFMFHHLTVKLQHVDQSHSFIVNSRLLRALSIIITQCICWILGEILAKHCVFLFVVILAMITILCRSTRWVSKRVSCIMKKYIMVTSHDHIQFITSDIYSFIPRCHLQTKWWAEYIF